MSTLACIVCRKALDSAIPAPVPFSEDNQPSEGTAFTTEGHYGSTAFDPMDGSRLEVNICDECLTRAGRDGLVLWQQAFRLIARNDNEVIVGREWLDRPAVEWSPDTVSEPEDHLYIDPREIGKGGPRFEWRGEPAPGDAVWQVERP